MARTPRRVLGLALTLGLGCGSDLLDADPDAEEDADESSGLETDLPGDDGDLPGDGDGDGDGDGEGDGDGDGGAVYCDVTVFESLEPMWFDERPNTGGHASITAVEVNESAVFVVGNPGSLERKSLAGETEWVVHDTELVSTTISIDDTHLYFESFGENRIQRRALADGAADDWTVFVDVSALYHVDARGQHVLVSGSLWGGRGRPEDPDPMPSSAARFRWYSKSDASSLGELEVGAEGMVDRGGPIMQTGSNLHMGIVDSPFDPYARVFRLDDPAAATTIEVVPESWGTFLLDSANGLVAGGIENDGYTSRDSWVAGIDPSGTLLWRKSVAPCGDIPFTSLGPAVAASDGIWAVVRVATGPHFTYWENEGLLVQFSWDGEVVAAYRVTSPSPDLYGDGIYSVVASGEVLIVHGFSSTDTESTTWVARVR